VAQVELNRVEGGVVCERCTVAATPFARMRGLLGRSELPPGEGMLLRPAGSVHTAFMRFPIDVVFLDGERRVVRIVPALRPWRFASARRADAVLELGAGECARVGLREGDVLEER
jgi:uncharacterized membrane protein (UPF0127 family)